MLYQPIHDWLREANSGDDATWRERVEEYVDLPQFVTQVAIESFLAENDGLLGYYGMNNFFLYRPAGSNASDSCPGTRTIVSSFLATRSSSAPIRTFSSLARLRIPICVICSSRCWSLRQTFRGVGVQDAPGWLESEIDRIAALVAPSVEEDQRKSFSTEAFYESVVTMREFARLRPTLVRQQISEIRGRR